MPQETIYTYNIDFRGTIIPKTGKKEETDKTFTVNVRIDSQWKIYDALRQWHRMVFDPKTNIALSDVLTRTPIVVQALDHSNKVVKSFTFTYCKLKDLKVTDFDNATGDPMRAELGFIYGGLEVD
jgi:hypothetical protein